MNDELTPLKPAKSLGIKYALRLLRTGLFIALLAVFTGVYFGRLFFGDNGTEVYTNLRAKCEHLKDEIKALNAQNAKLQKEYFELKSIQGN